MSIKFDAAASGEGVEVKCRLENGKVLLEWRFHYENDDPGQGCYLRLRMTDREGRMVLECMQQTQEEESLQSVLLHPHLWQGTESPYLYRLEARIFTQSGKQVDKCVRLLSLYTLEYLPEKGILLNGEPFCPKTVRYRLPERGCAGSQQLIMQDMRMIRELGANSVFLEEAGERTGSFFQVCERMGLLVLGRDMGPIGKCRNLPLFYGEKGSLLKADGTPSSDYYKYQARWSKTPFVYIVPESIRQSDKGGITVSVYSSCKKVALYTNGILHEFQSGKEEFIFYGITAKTPCLILTAEAEECAHSLSVHKTFTNLSLFRDI